jgi:hypothetical protein
VLAPIVAMLERNLRRTEKFQPAVVYMGNFVDIPELIPKGH